jgi:hypothetical protein
MDLFKASKNIHVFDAGKKKYFFFDNILVAIMDYDKEKVYIERKDMRKGSLMKYLNEQYYVKNAGFKIVECYAIRNMLHV